MRVPPPAAVIASQAVIDTWGSGLRVTRAHSHLFGSAQFDDRSHADARFSTIWSGRTVIPVLYGGEDDEAAASETIFHTIDAPIGAHRPRQVALDKYRSWQWSEVVSTRDMTVVRLEGRGLDALGVTRAELIEGGRGTYPQTRSWAQALAAALPEADGLWWRSRQAPGRWALLLFGHLRRRPGGVRDSDLMADRPAVPFASIPGLHRLDQIADNLDITIIRS